MRRLKNNGTKCSQGLMLALVLPAWKCHGRTDEANKGNNGKLNTQEMYKEELRIKKNTGLKRIGVIDNLLMWYFIYLYLPCSYHYQQQYYCYLY